MSDLIIDVHSHPLLPAYRRAISQGLDPAAANTHMGMPLPSWSVEQQLEAMDQHGIGVSMLSLPAVVAAIRGANGRAQARAMNEELAALVAQHPSRFGAFAVVPMDDMDGALEEMAYALDVLKLDGVGVSTHCSGVYLGDSYYEPWFAEMNRRGTTLFVHPDAPHGFDPIASKTNVAVLEFMFDTTRMVTNMVLSGAKQRFSNINIIATHGGGTIPYLAQRIALAGSFPWAYRGGQPLSPADTLAVLGSFYFDLTASTSKASLDSIRSLVPVERLLMGFDFPMMPPMTIAPALNAFSAYSEFGEVAQQNIRRVNALGLFPRFA